MSNRPEPQTLTPATVEAPALFDLELREGTPETGFLLGYADPAPALFPPIA